MSASPELKFTCIKGATLSNNLVGGAGYLIGPDGDTSANPIRHCLTLTDDRPFSFLFGLLGVGYHYRLDVRPQDSVLALYQIRDGIPLYLHHFSTLIAPNASISVDVFHSQARVGLNGYQIMHALVDPTMDARIGFAPLHSGGFRLPCYRSIPLPPPVMAWVCLGDGFSNARWRNRDFLSWPELVFGNRDDWFNGCVAAGNSRRVRQLVTNLAPLCGESSILIATGSDDQMEGEHYGAFEDRLHAIIGDLRSSGTKSIHVATLPPRASAMAKTREWSEHIATFAHQHQIGVLDFHQWLQPNMTLMVRGEYPGADAQKLLAAHVAKHLSLSLPMSPQESMVRANPTGVTARLLRKIHKHLEQRFSDFPGVLR